MFCIPQDTVDVIASLVDVLWSLRRVDEACSLLARQLELQAQQPNTDALLLAQGHAALGVLNFERKERAAALAAFEQAERSYLSAIELIEQVGGGGGSGGAELQERKMDIITELASTLNSMAMVLQEREQTSEALRRMLQAVELCAPAVPHAVASGNRWPRRFL